LFGGIGVVGVGGCAFAGGMLAGGLEAGRAVGVVHAEVCEAVLEGGCGGAAAGLVDGCVERREVFG